VVLPGPPDQSSPTTSNPPNGPAIAQPSAENPLEPDQNDAAILQRMRDKAREKRQYFLDTFNQIEEFSYGKDYNKLIYDQDTAANKQNFMHRAKINRASEFAEIVGSYLFPKVPDAQINSRTWATYWEKKRHKVEQDYMKYVLAAGDMHSHARRQITEACLSGKGVLKQAFNSKKGIVQNIYKSCRDLLLDPDAKADEDLNFIVIRNVKPKWELKQILERERGDNVMDGTVDSMSTSLETDTQVDRQISMDSVEYYEFYLTVGLWRFGQTSLGAEASPDDPNTLQQDDSPRKYYWIPGKVLAIAEWEIPWFLIDEWPLSWVDLRPRPNHLWPAAPMEPGLGHLIQMNWAYTFFMNRMRFAWRTFLIAVSYNGQGVDDNELMKMVFNDDFSFLRMKVNGDAYKFNDLVQQFKFDAGVQEFKDTWALLSEEFAKSTGLSEILYDGEGVRQSRIKADVEFKDKQSKNRIEDMRLITLNHWSKVYRKCLFAARYLHTPDEISTILGPEAGSIWGTLSDPQQVLAEAQQRQQQKQMIQAQFQQQLAQYQQAVSHIPPPPPGMPPNVPPPPQAPTDDQMEMMLGPPRLVSQEEWVHTADRTIDAGSAVPQDLDAKSDGLHAILTQLVPVLGPLPQSAQFIAAAVVEFLKLGQFSPDLIACGNIMLKAATAPPPMMPMPLPHAGPAGPSGPPPAHPGSVPPTPSPPANQNPVGAPPGKPVG